MDPASTRVALALGGNHPDSPTAMRQAWRALSGLLGDARVSRLFRSAPLAGGPRQPDYWNAVVVGRTDLDAADLLAAVKRIELALGRKRGVRWGPRRVDIDLLLHGQSISRLPELLLPHPGLLERDFVLLPLAQLAGDWTIPGGEVLTVAAALERLPGPTQTVQIDERLDRADG